MSSVCNCRHSSPAGRIRHQRQIGATAQALSPVGDTSHGSSRKPKLFNWQQFWRRHERSKTQTPGFNSSPGNFNERNNHEKFSLRNRFGRALPLEGHLGLEHLVLRRWHAGAHRHGTGVLGLAQPRGPGGVTVAVVKKEKPTSKSASFYLSVRGEGRNRAGTANFGLLNLRIPNPS